MSTGCNVNRTIFVVSITALWAALLMLKSGGVRLKDCSNCLAPSALPSKRFGMLHDVMSMSQYDMLLQATCPVA